MDEFECCEDQDDTIAWKLSWVDVVRWGLTAVNCLAQGITLVSEKINDDLVMHQKYLKEREDFAAEAGRELEMLTAGTTEEN